MRVISIGTQSFEEIRTSDYFFVDKTNFIKELWENGDAVTLITRPRRFGKTLNMDMLNCFFSNRFAQRGELFEGLSIWKEEKYRQLQGTYPVIYLSFADVKQTNYKDAVAKIKNIITKLYNEHYYLANWQAMTTEEKTQFLSVGSGMDDVTAHGAIKDLCDYLYRYYGKKVIVLLDEYDTPMQEAYVGGYWDEFTAFIRALFNATFKTNPYLHKAVLTGITRVSKESIFSDLNNLTVITSMSKAYADCFGFTQQEVSAALDEMGLSGEKDMVKAWYDGFTFGPYKDIYNPWSVTNFLKYQKYSPYWASTSSNRLLNKLMQGASSDIKMAMERLLNGEILEAAIDEQVVFNQLDYDEQAIFSLMLAGGYLKVEHMIEWDEYGEPLGYPIYHLKLTNKEVHLMFQRMFADWFAGVRTEYNGFVKALLARNLEDMNHYMNRVALTTFSHFDTGNRPSGAEPERFYHGFVLGLLVELRSRYEVISNGESGRGRYDVMLIPRNGKDAAYVLEFKVHDPKKETNLEATAASALEQIEKKQYDVRLLERGIQQENIVHYGFAFEGKQVLIETHRKKVDFKPKV